MRRVEEINLTQGDSDSGTDTSTLGESRIFYTGASFGASLCSALSNLWGGATGIAWGGQDPPALVPPETFHK